MWRRLHSSCWRQPLLRFANLPVRGLIYWDEGKFLLEGVRLETGLRILAGAHSSLPAGKAIGTAKPTHALLIALAFLLFGAHDYSALFLNAFAGVMAVIVVYRIAALLFDPTVGLVAALVLAVSEYDVIYSRSALSESDANALLLLGVLLWVYERCRTRPGPPTGGLVDSRRDDFWSGIYHELPHLGLRGGRRGTRLAVWVEAARTEQDRGARSALDRRLCHRARASGRRSISWLAPGAPCSFAVRSLISLRRISPRFCTRSTEGNSPKSYLDLCPTCSGTWPTKVGS